ncbi:serine/threonine protein kinase [Pyxidicoccus trucidator]|uniref:serine/threonine protein kinase n=1 Tax=Pyxidicoccus trucidator TaxID=2709662 RepID=UPI0013DBB416|nr:serine/threonine-protein kinase [Pyxidicoccus trucidator]
MTSDILHPDTLLPGDTVGPFKILDVLGAGGLGRVFKVEQDSKVYALKMATRLPGQRAPGEEDVDGRCQREASAMLARMPDPHFPRVFHVGRWPDPEAGFLFVVMEYVDGWPFHEWRYEKHPSAAQLVDVLLPLVRTLDEMHRRGMHHRDLHAGNVLIRKEDSWPFLLDLGSVSMPGARTLTQGMPPINLTIIPPEALEQAMQHGDEARFEGGPAVDLYALGVLLYSALTDGHPINMELPPERLAAAIRLRMPRPPHRVNPKVPPSLGAIAMRLLAKRPEDRYESAHALYQALWEANKQRTSRAWKVPLDLPESGPAPMTEEEWQERKLDEDRARGAPEDRVQQEGQAPPAQYVEVAPPVEELFAPMRAGAARSRQQRLTWMRVRRPLVGALSCALVVGLGALVGWGALRRDTPPVVAVRPTALADGTAARQEVAPPENPPEADRAAAPPVAVSTPAAAATPAMPQKDDASVKMPKKAPPLKMQPKSAGTVGKALALTLTCTGLACTGAQVRPAPPSEECPPGAVEAMKQWGINVGDVHSAVFTASRRMNPSIRIITVKEGPTSLSVSREDWGSMPDYDLTGRLILGERVHGRLTQAQTRDGKETFPICMELLDYDERVRGVVREPDGGPDTARVFFGVWVKAVSRFE